MTDEQLQAWTAEAEAGYDVAALKRRGRGRPGRGASPSQVIAVRLIDDEIEILDRMAATQNLTRSEALRRALMSAA
ncbi:ribbon-helix-helix protein, CopG family [Actinomyces faecalis]|uniref:ribbon-helix-helix protein, CopG family n=1 Tax=Actinomyces faecalis TaxID=2722820 RepID=UPI001FD36BFF|nr:ribbon-helix-helix protein, CopG family [Actinomyces faecalis]